MKKKILNQLTRQKWVAFFISFLILSFLIYRFINGSKISNLSQTYNLAGSIDRELNSFLMEGNSSQKEKILISLTHIHYVIEKNERPLIEKIKSDIVLYDSLKTLYQANLEQIIKLNEKSILASNTYINKTAQKLASDKVQKSVTKLERLVIIGALKNTNLNHKINKLVLVLNKDTAVENKLIQLLDISIKNVKNDIKQLRGTPFEYMPRDAINSNKKIKQIVIQNVSLNKHIKAITKELVNVSWQLNVSLQKDNKYELNATLNKFSLFSTSLLLLVFLGAIFTAIYATKFNSLFSQYILNTTSTFRKLRKGVFDHSDLTLIMKEKNEMGYLSQNLSVIISKLGDIIVNSKKNADEVRGLSNNMSSASENLSQNTAESASSMEESSSAIEEMSANLEAVAVHSKNVEQKIKRSNEKVKIVSKVVEKTAKSLKDNAEISNVIKAISHKIDILSINAAIEAARAGDAGSGFSVIAEEIRKLSDMTQVSAEKIEKMALGGEKMANNSLKITEGLVIEIEKAVNLVVDLEFSIEEIKDGSGQISSSTTQLNQTTQENAQLAEELAQQSEQIKELSNVLDFGDELFQYKENEEEFSKVDVDILFQDKEDEEKLSDFSKVDINGQNSENTTKDSPKKKEKSSINNILKSEDEIDDEFEKMD